MASSRVTHLIDALGGIHVLGPKLLAEARIYQPETHLRARTLYVWMAQDRVPAKWLTAMARVCAREGVPFDPIEHLGPPVNRPTPAPSEVGRAA